MSSLEWQTDTYFQYIYDRLDNFVNSSYVMLMDNIHSVISVSSAPTQYTATFDGIAVIIGSYLTYANVISGTGYVYNNNTNACYIIFKKGCIFTLNGDGERHAAIIYLK